MQQSALNDLGNFIVSLALWIAFLYLAGQAGLKYWSQPISTRVFQTIGDDGTSISFPEITICNRNMVGSNEYLAECANGTTSYVEALFSCLNKEEDFPLSDFLSTLRLERKALFTDAEIKTVKRTSLGLTADELDSIWHPVMAWKFGPCQRLSLSKLPVFNKYAMTLSDTIPSIEFAFKHRTPWKEAVVLIHSDDDLPDALDLQPRIYVTTNTNKIYHAIIKKKIVNDVRTRQHPCGEHTQMTCTNIESFKAVVDGLNCHISYLFNDTVLSSLHDPHRPLCNKSQILHAKRNIMDVIWSKLITGPCLSKQPCNYTRYTMTLEEFKGKTKGANKGTTIKIEFSGPIVDQALSFVSYDLQSLISEVGGALGLTLGLSGLSLTHILCHLLSKAWQCTRTDI